MNTLSRKAKGTLDDRETLLETADSEMDCGTTQATTYSDIHTLFLQGSPQTCYSQWY